MRPSPRLPHRPQHHAQAFLLSVRQRLTIRKTFPFPGLPAAALLLLGLVATPWFSVMACPFCESVQQTIRQQSLTMDAVVIASSLDGETTRNLTTGVVKMKIEKVIKGSEHIKVGQEVDAIYYGKVEVGRRFLLSGVDPPNLQWSCLPVSERAEEYIVKASQVEDDPVKRLQFFRHYLEDEEALISRDAYDEFASTPYDIIQQIGPDMDRDQLIHWVQQPEIGADRKRLYFTMLGVCGSKDDLPMLEEMLRNPAKSVTGGLDALIACYLTLAGESGLPLINELFIDNHKAPFPQSYAAIMAIRFHGTDGGVIPRSALVESLHKILDRSELADMVIPDLAKWNDWSQIERLKTLFKEAEKDKNWLRVPVINYMRACPLPEAAAAIEELEKIDPEAVRRAKTFFPIPVPVRAKPAEEATSQVVPAVESIKLGTRFAAVAPVSGGRVGIAPAGLRGESAGGDQLSNRAILAQQANPWDLGYVITVALATIVLALFLVLTGGPATGVKVA
ncbi:hypothetical protein Mal15_05550 [Stieleria maiorica]|uniref:Uncharacterized protein n=1 Tax=Stieleria maiorica TaxID=2795974 RepID=A0A5B9MBF2_9BACT|nr:hypothetical protein [Stieleria maiorica]QEF96527.1 hypothetical protein Mal15_05550 [Stieleria maiorica]